MPETNNKLDSSVTLRYRAPPPPDTASQAPPPLNVDFEVKVEQLFVDNLVPETNNKLDSSIPLRYRAPPTPDTASPSPPLLNLDFSVPSHYRAPPTPDTASPPAPLPPLNIEFEVKVEQLSVDNLATETNNKLDPPISPPSTAPPLPKTAPPPLPSSSSSVDDLIHFVETGKQHLNTTEQYVSNLKFSHLTKEKLEALQGTPQYMQELKNIVRKISETGCKGNFKNCSAEELERYMYFLGRYAEVCVNSCNKHVNTVLDALADYKSVVV